MRTKNLERIMRYGIVIVMLGLLVGCSEEEPPNNPPVINSFTASTTKVISGSEVMLTGLVTDPDGDSLTYTYQTTGGIITGTGNTVIWVVPDAAGDYTVTVDVSDGELNVQDLVTIAVVLPDPSVAPEGMVLIPAGEFPMGDHFNEGNDDELPVHTVYLDAFYMDIYEVTNAQYQKFTDATGHSVPTYWNDFIYNAPEYNAPEQPVVGISWHDAVAYSEWSGKRLPTEAEWEKAARGGLSGKRYPWGDEISHDDANYSGTGGKDVWFKASPVGSFAPNGYGLYDMAGNVYERCTDWYDRGYYANSPPNNPLGPDSGSHRVFRGGSWFYLAPTLRVALRGGIGSGTSSYVGFRCVSRD